MAEYLCTAKTQNQEDVIIGKINKDGNFQWIREVSGKYDQIGNKIRVTDQGDVYFTGTFSGNISAENIVIQSKGGYDFFCGKLTSDNHLEWIRTAGSVENDTGYTVEVDTEDNVYFGGYLNPETTFYDDADSIQLIYLNDIYNEGLGFLAKYDHSGSLEWVLNGNANSSNILDIHIDSNNKLYFAGYFSPGAVFNDMPIPVTNYKTSNFFAGSLQLNTITGLEQEHITDEATLYPNPSKGFVDIIVPQMGFEAWTYKLYDQQGHVIKYETISFKEKTTLNFSNLRTGVYTLVFVQDKKYFFKRIVIEP